MRNLNQVPWEPNRNINFITYRYCVTSNRGSIIHYQREIRMSPCQEKPEALNDGSQLHDIITCCIEM